MAADGRRAFIENTLTHSATRRHRPSYTLHHHHQQQHTRRYTRTTRTRISNFKYHTSNKQPNKTGAKHNSLFKPHPSSDHSTQLPSSQKPAALT